MIKSAGFTLIELMITVAILGVISSIAFPAYTSYVVRGKRTECRSAITQVMQQQERAYTQTNTYGTYTAVTTPNTFLTFSGDTSAASACALSAESCGSGISLASCVLVRGTPNFTDTEVNQITMRSDGTKSCTGTNTAKCWK